MHQWQLSATQLNHHALTPAEKHFASCFYQWNEWLSEQKWWTLDTWAQALLTEEFPLLQAPSYQIYGFESLHPLQEQLKKLWKLTEFKPALANEPHRSCELKQVFSHPRYQAQAALEWLLAQPDERTSAIVVPQLAQDFSFWQRQVALAHHSKQRYLPPWPQADALVSLSAGLPLAQWPVIASLFQLWEPKICAKPLTYLSSLLANFLAAKNLVSSLQDWISALVQELDRCRWCCDLELTSVEFQARQKFLDVLHEFSLLSAALKPRTHYLWGCLLLLNCQLQIFQPESLAHQRYVLGLLEAAPLHLEHVWLVDCDELHFPSTPAESLLPPTLRKSYRMPHCEHAREISYLRSICQRLREHSCSLRLSYARNQNDYSASEAPCLKSIFPGPWKEASKSFGATKTWSKLAAADNQPAPSSTLTVSQLQNFALCPFMGFATQLRIPGCKAQPQLPWGYQEQGQWLHSYVSAQLNQRPLPSLYKTSLAPAFCTAESSRLRSLAAAMLNTLAQHYDLTQLQSELPIKWQFHQTTLLGRIESVVSTNPLCHRN